jgi:hypothetical protein
MLLLHAEFTMRPAEPVQVGGKLPGIVPVRHELGHGLPETRSLGVHGGREHRPDLWFDSEQMAVEIGHGRIRYGIDRRA